MTESTVADEIGREIVEIMETYDAQMERDGYIGTPGGLEHMGDVWSLLDQWRDRLLATQKSGSSS